MNGNEGGAISVLSVSLRDEGLQVSIICIRLLDVRVRQGREILHVSGGSHMAVFEKAGTSNGLMQDV